MLMEPSHYLDSEILKHSNYPEIKQVQSSLSELDAFAMTVNSALAGYIEGIDDKVYIDMNTMENNIALCREVLEVLGLAEQPCYDIIIDLRIMLESFYEILYTYRKYGKEYIDYKLTSEGGYGFGD